MNDVNLTNLTQTLYTRNDKRLIKNKYLKTSTFVPVQSDQRVYRM
jgi:hypothetical protein